MNRFANLLAGILIILLQVTLANLISIQSIKPDLVVIFLVGRALAQGPTAGVVWGFGLGFLLDTLSSNLMGLGALSYSVAGFLSGQIGAGKVTGRLGYLLILALAAVAAHTILFYFTEPWKEGGFWKLFMMPTMPRILYTWILGLFWIISPFPRFNAAKKHASAGKEL